MKTLLVFFACILSYNCFAQDSPDVRTLLRQYQPSNRKTAIDSLLPLRKPADSILPRLKNRGAIPNPLATSTIKARKIGNNGHGHDVFVLALANMPCLHPDSTYLSKMPVAGSEIWLRKP